MPQSSELQELMRSTARNLVYTIAGLYLGWHFVATLGYPRLFSPSIWLVSVYMLGLVSVTLRLLKKRYILGQLVWLTGLAGAIGLGYFLYRRVEILLLLTLLPLASIVTLGLAYTLGVSLLIGLGAFFFFSLLGENQAYLLAIMAGSVFTALFGWGVSSNLLTALNVASYHYNEAKRLLEETRDHRAEISRMLKDRNQVNYQLERMNEMLAAARAQAEDARENRSRFMLAVSHELRSPLNFIIGFSDLMVNAPETYAALETWPPGLYDDAQEIYTSSRHLLRLINDILDMGKIGAGQMSLYREKASLEQVIEDVQSMLRGAFEKKGIALRVDLPPALPLVSMDTTRIRQVLLNLLNNGLRFTEQGSVSLQVQVLEAELLVSVSDTGAGIASEDLPKVFDEFRQVGEENWRRRAGTGLGLYISRQFVELHGGSMKVESRLGEGTRFMFSLPLEDAPTGALSSSSGAPLPPKENHLLFSVGFDEETHAALGRFLPGYTLLNFAESPQAAAGLLQHFPRAILLASQAAPLEASALPYALPVIRLALSKSGLQASNLRAHLVKPARRKTLLKALRSLPEPLNTLLVVDDDPAMLRFVRQALRAEGWNVRLLGAESAACASAVLEANPVDAILLDLELPDQNGQVWLNALPPAWKDIPVIVISAQDAAEISAPSPVNALEVNLARSLLPPETGLLLQKLLELFPPQYPRR